MLLSVSPRAINTPTLLEEYEADQKGYDQFADEDTVITLSREHDRVQGNEAFYKVLLNNLSTPTSVTGNEGFMSTLKAGANKAIEVVKSFFKWLFSFFGGKKEATAHKAKNTALALDKHGVKDGEVAYPASYISIYNAAGKPQNNLGWMPSAFDHVKDTVANLKKYAALVETTVTSAVRELNAKQSGNVSAVITEFYKDTPACFGIKGVDVTGTLLGTSQVKFTSHGKMERVPSNRPLFKDSVFKTNLSETTKLLHQHKVILDTTDTMLEKTTALEDSLTKVLKSIYDTTDKASADAIQTMVRTVMANIKSIETSVFRGLAAGESILSSAVNKG